MNFPLGIGVLLLAALMNGNFALPMKYAKRWNFEIVWLVYTLLALILMPWVLTSIAIPNFRAVYAACSARDILVPVIFGLGWGVAQVLYGLGVSSLGLSLGNSIITGIAATLGSGIPMVALHREKVFAPEGLSILAGILVMLFGIYFCGVAGHARETKHAKQADGSVRRRYGLALFICILCGMLAPMMTLALAFGTPVMDRAVAMGVRTTDATYLIWDLVLPVGALVSLAYCLLRMKRNHSWKQFLLAGTRWNWFMALAMAILWGGGVLLYGISTVYIGPLGVPVAQAIFVVFLILGANATGFLMGEWRGITGAPIRSLVTGIALLGLACVVIAIGNK